MNLSANHRIWGRKRLSRDALARLTVILVGLTTLLLPLVSRAETPLQAWERVEAIRQEQGPERALPLARNALHGQPDFPPLWSQYARLRASLGGYTGARGLRDSLRAHGTLTQARVTESFLAAEESRFQAALDTLALLSLPPAGTPGEVFRWLDLAAINVSARQLDRADSLLILLSNSTAIPPGEKFAHSYVRLTMELLRAALQLHQGQHDLALARLDRLAKGAASEGFLDLSMRAQHLRARSLSALGRYEPSLAAYESELVLAHKLEDRWQIAAIAAWKAWALEQLTRYDAALKLRRLCLVEFPQLGDTLGTSYSLLSMGWDALQIGETDTAENLMERARRFGRQRKWKWMEGQACINLGVLYMNSGRFDLSMEALERARTLASEEKDTYRERSALNNIAILHMERGRPDRALEIYEKLLAIQREHKNYHAQVTVLNNMALASERMGQDAQARVMYEQSVALAEERGLPNNVARINLGRNASVNGRWAEGEHTLRAAIADARKRQDTGQLAAAHAQLGSCLWFQGKGKEARDHLLIADRLRRDAGIVMERVHDLLQLAQVEIGLQRGSDALATLDRAQPLVMGNASGSEAALYSIRARALLEQGAIEAARSQARRALAVASTSWVGEDAGTRLGQQIAAGRALEVMLESAKGSGESESRDVARETFELLQQVQAHGLLEYVQGGQRSIEPDVPDSLLEQERAARVAVDHLQQELGSGPNSAASRDSLRLALAEAQARQERLRTLIFRLDQRYREMTQPAEVDSSQLDRLLAPGTLILDYLCGRGCQPGDSCPLLLFAADSSGVNAYTLGQTTDIARQVALLSDLLAHPPARGKDEDVQLLLSDLGHVLLGPVAERIDRYDSVIVVPDGVLTRVPFAALRVPIAGNPSHEVYVLEKTTIQTVPSLAVLSQLRRAQLHEHAARPRWDIAIWSGSGSATEAGGTRSNPSLKLPHAEDELRVLRSGFARTTVLQVNSKELRASHGELSSLVPVGSSKVLHFIAHGYFDRRQPWRSGLYFTGGPNGQSLQKLEIADIYRMKLQCSLVTLSACETARGSFDEGVGFLGLTQALFGSGVPSVLATLWPIDDASAPKFISAFYRQLVTGSTKAEALRQAQLQFLQDEKFRQPFYWAPYVLMGDGAGTVKLTLRRSVSLATPGVTLAIGLLLLLAALWSWRRRVGH